MKGGKELAEEHWEWLSRWVKDLEFPSDHADFVRLIERAYKDAFEHGHKHGKNDKE